MSRPYANIDSQDFLRNLVRRIGVLERGGSKSLIPGSPEMPTGDVDGAQIFLHEGRLYVRIGTTSHQLTTGGPDAWGENMLPTASGGWTEYQPELQGEVASPDGWVASGRYALLGPVVHVEICIAAPASWDRGQGDYRITLPRPSVGYSTEHQGTLFGEFHDGTTLRVAIGHLGSDESVVSGVFRDTGGELAAIGHSTPWSSGRLTLSGTYQVTS